MKRLGKHLLPKTKLICLLGSTECGFMFFKHIKDPTHVDFPSSIVPVGRSFAGTICLLLDDNQCLITYCDQIGELYIGGKLTSYISHPK